MLHSSQHWLQSFSAVQHSMIVARIAFGFRILSYIIISPLVIVGILDIVAYVIARTLQAFDHLPHVKLGQSHVDIIISEEEALLRKKLGDADDEHKAEGSIEAWGSNTNISSSSSGRDGGRSDDRAFKTSYQMSSPYSANEELSGVGLFSPAPTRPTSPTIRHEKKGTDATSTLGSSFLVPSTPSRD